MKFTSLKKLYTIIAFVHRMGIDSSSLLSMPLVRLHMKFELHYRTAHCMKIESCSMFIVVFSTITYEIEFYYTYAFATFGILLQN